MLCQSSGQRVPEKLAYSTRASLIVWCLASAKSLTSSVMSSHMCHAGTERRGEDLPQDDVWRGRHSPGGVCRTPQSAELQPGTGEVHQAQQTSAGLATAYTTHSTLATAHTVSWLWYTEMSWRNTAADGHIDHHTDTC